MSGGTPGRVLEGGAGAGEAPSTAPARRRHTWADIYHERTHFEFIERSWRWLLLSGTLVLVSLIALAASGLNLGIDFNGGTQFQLSVAGRTSVTADQVRTALVPVRIGDAKILIVGGNGVRVQTSDLTPARRTEVAAALATFGRVDAAQVSVTAVGPTWGDTVTRKALVALGVFFVIIAGYLSLRFDSKMAVAAIVAVLHDIVLTVGVYAVTGFEVVPGTVVAFLTILGFSLYDTVVVFDKVNENLPTLGTERADTYSRMVNRSLNQVLLRSINTSVVALLPVVSLLFVGSLLFGAITLKDFALALFVGLLTGTYSSIFVATPVLAFLKEREPRHVAIRERALVQVARDAAGDGAPSTAPAAAAPASVTAGAPRAASSGARRPAATPGPVTPRPRQPRRRKRR